MMDFMIHCCPVPAIIPCPTAPRGCANPYTGTAVKCTATSTGPEENGRATGG